MHDDENSESTDEALFAAYLGGDTQAFRQLFARYARRIFSVMVRRGLGDTDAHDIVQQTFLLLHQARKDFTPGLRVRPWLWTIAFNLSRATQRARERAKGRLERLAQERDTDAPSLLPQEETYGVRLAISELSAHQQEVVMLHWYEGLTFSEIASVVQASESAVKVRAHRAYQRLRELLDEPPSRTGGSR